MELEPCKYYHIYNRSNGGELVFKSSENYKYFLGKFRERLDDSLIVYAYCLMPTHFHFLAKVVTDEITHLKKQIGLLLSSYTKAYNIAYQSHGSLFQQHTKAILIDDENYLLTLLSYIHQNPIRANLVKRLEDWPFSSYRDLAGLRNGTLPNKTIIRAHFSTTDDFITFSKQTISDVSDKYWI